MCEYQVVRQVSFSENFVYVLNEWFLYLYVVPISDLILIVQGTQQVILKCLMVMMAIKHSLTILFIRSNHVTVENSLSSALNFEP